MKKSPEPHGVCFQFCGKWEVFHEFRFYGANLETAKVNAERALEEDDALIAARLDLRCTEVVIYYLLPNDRTPEECEAAGHPYFEELLSGGRKAPLPPKWKRAYRIARRFFRRCFLPGWA